MAVETIDLGNDLEHLVNYPTGTFLPLAEAGRGMDHINYEGLHFFTVLYFKGRNFKVIPELDLRFFKPPTTPPMFPKYEKVRTKSTKEFAIVRPKGNKGISYAVLTDDPRYVPGKSYDEGTLRYMGSPLDVHLCVDDARRHKVLMAGFGSDQAALAKFLQEMKNKSGRDFRVKVNISILGQDPVITTSSLTLYTSRKKPQDTLVVKAKNLGKRYLYSSNR